MNIEAITPPSCVYIDIVSLSNEEFTKQKERTFYLNEILKYLLNKLLIFNDYYDNWIEQMIETVNNYTRNIYSILSIINYLL